MIEGLDRVVASFNHITGFVSDYAARVLNCSTRGGFSSACGSTITKQCFSFEGNTFDTTDGCESPFVTPHLRVVSLG